MEIMNVINTGNLHTLIDCYEENYDYINDKEHNEVFKWKAVQQFRSVWFSENKPDDFSVLFNEAKKECSVLIDNGFISPANGIVKIAEKYPTEVEQAFREILFAPDDGNIYLKQDHADSFIDEINKLCLEAFPSSYKYKQERHAASCYMFFNDPEHNYIYRNSEATQFAKFIEFSYKIGSGQNFSLKNYYILCDKIVEALKDERHASLLNKYHELINSSDAYYKDESLHLLAFDVMYCCLHYKLYINAVPGPSDDVVNMRNRISELELSIEQIKDISLLNVQVHHAKYGDGIISEQDVNRITVKFPEAEKKFIIHKDFSDRPTFEDDAEIVDKLTKYADTRKVIERFEKQLNSRLKNTK